MAEADVVDMEERDEDDDDVEMTAAEVLDKLEEVRSLCVCVCVCVSLSLS